MIDSRHRRPNCNAVTVFANVCRQYVLRVLAGGNRAVVAAHAIADDIRMIEIRRCPCDRGVAVVTVVATRDMCRMFAGSRDAVMTGRTTAEYLCVIYRYHGYPGCRAVAVLANIRRLNVRRSLAGCIGTIVASHAIVGNIDVVEIRGYPGDRGVAVIAVIATRNMHRVFAGRSDTVMTAAATTQHLGMIDDDCRYPDRWAVTVFANTRCNNVHWPFASRIGAVVAGHAVADDVRMIEIRWCPGDRGVAVVTIIAARNMREIFPCCGEAVMAGAAAAQHLGVVNRNNRLPHDLAVAVFANVRRLNMCGILSCCTNTVVAANAITENVVMVEDSG